MGAGTEEDDGDPLLPEPPAELLVIGEDVTSGLEGDLDNSIIPAVFGGDDLIFACKREGCFGIPVLDMLQFPDSCAGDDDPRLAQQVPEGEVEVHLDLKRHE